MKNKKYGQVKYRKSIVKSMNEDFVKKYGFEDSYRRFESSINRMSKEGDVAEELAIKYLKSKGLLSDNYRENAIIALNTIKIEADIIDYDNKIIYETKSRKSGELAKLACKQKWYVFEYDRQGSIYEEYEFKGIVVANYETGQKVKGIVSFDPERFNSEKQERDFKEHFKRIEYFKSIKRSKGYDDNGMRMKYYKMKKAGK